TPEKPYQLKQSDWKEERKCQSTDQGARHCKRYAQSEVNSVKPPFRSAGSQQHTSTWVEQNHIMLPNPEIRGQAFNYRNNAATFGVPGKKQKSFHNVLFRWDTQDFSYKCF